MIGRRPSRRTVMYGLVGAQLVVVAAIVVPQELNRALDTGPTVDVEIVQARAGKDPFRGAYVYGQSVLDLDGPTVPIPAGLRGGDRVSVTFAVEAGRRPRIVAVDRGRRRAPFTATTFNLPGRVVDQHERRSGSWRDRQMRAYVGKPAVPIDLELPASIGVDESAVGYLAGPGMVHASLHAGFLGHPYFTNVRLSGRAWTPEARFAYDETRQRLIVFAPREISLAEMSRRRGGARGEVHSDLFRFDAAGKEVGAAEVEGRIVDGVVDGEGRLLALVAPERWSSEVALVRLDEGGQVLQRSVPIALDRVLGFDARSATVWIVAAPTAPRAQPPHFIQRMGVDGTREPRLGPFHSVPRAVVAGDDVWVLETQQHRVTRLDAASGRIVREYKDLNDPAEIAVDGATLYVIEANRTQLTSIAEDGRILWRRPRFQGLTWAVPDPARGGGWVGAAMFEGAAASVLRFERDGTIARLPASARPAPRGDGQRRVAGDVVRSARDGRLFFREPEAIAILSADGATVTRVVGFRFPGGPRLRS